MKLKNLRVRKVDFVDEGANPDAHLLIRKDKGGQDVVEGQGILQRIFAFVGKAAGLKQEEINSAMDEISKGDAVSFGETFNEAVNRKIADEIWETCHALQESLVSILNDCDLDGRESEEAMRESLAEFGTVMERCVSDWSGGRVSSITKDGEVAKEDVGSGRAETERPDHSMAKTDMTEKGTMEKRSESRTMEGEEEMKIDKSKMSQDELAVLEGFEKKYGIVGAPEEGDRIHPDGVPDVAKGMEHQETETQSNPKMHPDVAKALSDFKELEKRHNAEIEELKKSLEIERLTGVAKKYEVLGKKAEELAGKLYDMKKAGGTVYDDYVALLDESVETVNKSGIFSEIGSNNQGSAGTEQTLGIKAAELAKSVDGGMTSTDAIIKAFEQNPDLAAQYEREYMGR